MPHPAFDRSRLVLQPLANREHDLTLADILSLDEAPPFDDAGLAQVAGRVAQVYQAGGQVSHILTGHPAQLLAGIAGRHRTNVR